MTCAATAATCGEALKLTRPFADTNAMTSLRAISTALLLALASFAFAGCGGEEGGVLKNPYGPRPAEVTDKSTDRVTGDGSTDQPVIYQLRVRHCDDNESFVSHDITYCSEDEYIVSADTYRDAQPGDRFNVQTRKLVKEHSKA
jgi:hypothetical protein